jgi:hypothetical protein
MADVFRALLPHLNPASVFAGGLCFPVRPRVCTDDAAVLTMRGPKVGTATLSGQRSARSTTARRACACAGRHRLDRLVEASDRHQG